jgi:phosphatidate cytidylyltransferase
MSLQRALHDPVFLRFAGVVLGVLLFAGLVLSVLRWGFGKRLESVWTTYRAWWIMAPLILGSVGLGRVPFILFVTGLSLMGFKEFARATGLYRDWGMTGAGYLAILAVAVTSLIPNPHTGQPGWYGMFMALPVYSIAAFLLVPIVRNQPEGQVQTLSLVIVGFLYAGWLFGHLAFLANSSDHAYAYILYLMFAVILNDVAAFTFGRTFGKHKLRSNISPNKTWEGALGALAVSLALPWLVRFALPHFSPGQLVLAGLIVGIGGQLGDLTLGVIKRDLGIKDMGNLIPGHGGVLDRMNSLIYTAPLFLHLVDFCHEKW